MKVVDFTNEELSRIKELYYKDDTLTFLQISDMINLEFHKGKKVRNEDSINIAMDMLATSDEY
jgi:hypothetical protein